MLYIYGIKNAEENIIGPPPNINNDGIVNILLLDIRDDYPNSNTYVAGYFDRNDQSDNSTSNHKDIIYIDTFPVKMNNSYPEEAIFTLAHEYEHLLHYNSDPDEIYTENGQFNPWLDEGLADFIPKLLGLGARDYGYNLANTSIGLDDWENFNISYYAKSALFIQILYEKFNISFISDIFNDSNYRQLESIREHYIYLYPDSDFNELFDEFVLATVLDVYPNSECIGGVSAHQKIIPPPIKLLRNSYCCH